MHNYESPIYFYISKELHHVADTSAQALTGTVFVPRWAHDTVTGGTLAIFTTIGQNGVSPLEKKNGWDFSAGGGQMSHEGNVHLSGTANGEDGFCLGDGSHDTAGEECNNAGEQNFGSHVASGKYYNFVLVFPTTFPFAKKNKDIP